jgi:hypothetical protein
VRSSSTLIPSEAIPSSASGLGARRGWGPEGGVGALSLHGLDSDGESVVCKESRGGIMMTVVQRSSSMISLWPRTVTLSGLSWHRTCVSLDHVKLVIIQHHAGRVHNTRNRCPTNIIIE